MSALSTRLTRGARACTASTARFTTAMPSSQVSASIVVNIEVVSLGRPDSPDDADGLGDHVADAVGATPGRGDAEGEEHARHPAAAPAATATRIAEPCAAGTNRPGRPRWPAPTLLASPAMVHRDPLPFDPISRAAELWDARIGPARTMAAVTSIMRVQQIVLSAVDGALRPHNLTFARYEALVLLTFSRSGRLPMRVMGDRLQLHPTSVTNIVDRLQADGLVRRTPTPPTGAPPWSRSPRPARPCWSARPRR